MTIQELLQAIDKIHDYFIRKYTKIDPEKHSLLRSMKLAEEVGELNEQILGHYGYERKEKSEIFSPEKLEDEIADVIFCTMMVAKSLDIDVEKALNHKMKKIKERLGIQ